MLKTTPTRATPDRAMPGVVMSLLVPGVGHLFMGLWIRGAVWLAGWLVLLVLGAGHLLPGLLLMLASGIDAFVASRPGGRTPPTERPQA